MAANDIDPEKLARYLSLNPDYRVLRRLKPLAASTTPATDPVKVLVVDTETTGLDPHTDKTFELGMVALEVDAKTGRFVRVMGEFSQLEDPGIPIPADITAMTGVTNDMVRGAKIDDKAATAFAAGAELVVAHCAAHDRPFMENRLPIFENLPWACSLAEIDWRGSGFGSSALDYLAYKLGFFFDGHRALADSHALSKVLCESTMPAGHTALQELIRASLTSEFRIMAVGAPFEAKDALYGQGYRWDGDERVWQITARSDDDYEEEMSWLKSNIFRHKPAKVRVETRDAYLKHSLRKKEAAWTSLGAQGDGSGGARRY
jgi:DNA polymerase-3 subunit epsilon